MGPGERNLVPHKAFKFPDTYLLVKRTAIAISLTKPETDSTEDRGKGLFAFQVPVGLLIFPLPDKLYPPLDIIAGRAALLARRYLVFVNRFDETPAPRPVVEHIAHGDVHGWKITPGLEIVKTRLIFPFLNIHVP